MRFRQSMKPFDIAAWLPGIYRRGEKQRIFHGSSR